MAYVMKLDRSSLLGSTIHPQPQMIPAALAVGEKEGLAGRDLITAVLLGFDLAARVGMAGNPFHEGERGFHGTGTCETFITIRNFCKKYSRIPSKTKLVFYSSWYHSE